MHGQLPRRRGRPPSRSDGAADTRLRLVRAGVEVLTEKGFTATGIEEVLSRVGVPKGSFYHYFASKEAFGLAALEGYADYFARKLDRCLRDPGGSPLAGLEGFMADAAAGMARHGYRRGCLVGNLGQEMSALPEAFRARLVAVFEDWEVRVWACLERARGVGEIAPGSDCRRLAGLFWIGWEGAVLRARLERSAGPLRLFGEAYLAMLRASQGAHR